MVIELFAHHSQLSCFVFDAYQIFENKNVLKCSRHQDPRGIIMPMAVATAESRSPAPIQTLRIDGCVHRLRCRRHEPITHHCRSTQNASHADSVRSTFVVPNLTRPLPDTSVIHIPDASRHVCCGCQPVTGGLRTTRDRGVMGGKVQQLREGDDHAM